MTATQTAEIVTSQVPGTWTFTFYTYNNVTATFTTTYTWSSSQLAAATTTVPAPKNWVGIGSSYQGGLKKKRDADEALVPMGFGKRQATTKYAATVFCTRSVIIGSTMTTTLTVTTTSTSTGKKTPTTTLQTTQTLTEIQGSGTTTVTVTDVIWVSQTVTVTTGGKCVLIRALIQHHAYIFPSPKEPLRNSDGHRSSPHSRLRNVSAVRQ